MGPILNPKYTYILTGKETLFDEKMRQILNFVEVKKIIFNNPATIVFWLDGTKTVCKAMEGQEFSEYYGFLACLAKKMFGSNSAINRLIEKKAVRND